MCLAMLVWNKKRIAESIRNVDQASKYTFEVSSKLRSTPFEVSSKLRSAPFEVSTKFVRNFFEVWSKLRKLNFCDLVQILENS